MNVRRLHADKTGLPGRKTETNDGEEDERHPTDLLSNAGEMGDEKDEAGYR